MEYMRSPTEDNCASGHGGEVLEDSVWLYKCKILGIFHLLLNIPFSILYLQSISIPEMKILPTAVLFVAISYATAALTLYFQ